MSKKKKLGRHSAVKYRVLTADYDVFGPWVPILAMSASKVHAVDQARQTTMMVRLERALRDLSTSHAPDVDSWRDMTDMLNFLQTLHELGWAQDDSGEINRTKLALEQAVDRLEVDGLIRLTQEHQLQLRAALTQFEDLVRAISAHSFWLAVKQTKTRVFSILRGGKRAGDVVVTV